MKNSFALSLSIHILLLFFLQIWHLKSKLLFKIPNIYRVELVSMPLVETVSIKTETVDQVPLPEKAAINLPKKEVKFDKKKTLEKEPATEEKKIAENTAQGGPMKIDARDFPFAFYINLLRHRIQENWKPPFQHTQQSSSLLATVSFTVMRNGKIVDIMLEKSSAGFLFDQAAQRAVHLANPLPPLPDEFIGDRLSVHVEFEGIW